MKQHLLMGNFPGMVDSYNWVGEIKIVVLVCIISSLDKLIGRSLQCWSKSG